MEQTLGHLRDMNYKEMSGGNDPEESISKERELGV